MGLRRSQTKGRVDPVPGQHVEPRQVLSIVDAVQHEELFASWFRDAKSWSSWLCFLKCMFALPLAPSELELFQRCTSRSAPSPSGYLEASLIVGRRGGKSLILALCAVYLSAFYNWRPHLVAGERAVVMVIAADRRQAGVILRYIKAFLAIPPLAGMIERETAVELELNNSVTIAIETASYKTVRGRTCVAVLADELAYWADENSANPDSEILAALRPSMITIPAARMLKASSPYARRGALWDDHKRFFGRDDATTLVWQADTRTMNPSISEAFIANAYEADPMSAQAEYGAQFRSDVEQFVSREAAEAVTIAGRFELPPVANIHYSAFCDPSGGGGSDSMTLAIGHKEGNLAVLDAVREFRPPFSPEAVVAELAVLLKTYRINTVFGDKFAGRWPAERFQVHHISYDPSARPKSDLYRDILPAINGGRVELLDHPKLISQLCALERKTARSGRDSIDHPPGANSHDDIINAVAGALTNLIVVEAPAATFGSYGRGGGWNGLYTTVDPNASAGSIYASAPPEWWARERGVYHPHDRARLIREGVIKPPEGAPK
jgi:hypothetical protein